MSSSYRAVFFDLGGTLFSYREVERWTIGAVSAFVQKLGVEAEPQKLREAYREASKAANARYVDQSFYLHRDLFVDIFGFFAERLGTQASPEDVDFAIAGLREAVVDNMALRADCLETLQTLKEKGLYLSIVSNIDDDYLLPMVANSGLEAVLDHWTSSEEARSCKPDSAFFRLALEKAGCSAEQVLFVGDSPTHDIQGAKDVGMTAVLIVEDDSRPPLQNAREAVAPDHEIHALSELIALVD